MCSSALAMSRSQMVSCRRAACWALLPRWGRSAAGFSRSFSGLGAAAFSASYWAFICRYWAKPQG